jgi:ribosomal RNA-processing protein 7
MSKSNNIRLLKGYRVIDIPLGMGLALHTIYLKEHSEKGENIEKQKSKTAFIGNVDYGLEMTHEEIDSYLRELFNNFGEVESVSVSKFHREEAEKKSNNYSRFAHLVFKKKNSLKLALTAPDSTYYELGKELSKNFGLKQRFSLKKRKTVEDISNMYPYCEIDPKELQEEVDIFMRDFEEQENSDKLERERVSRLPDDDGFMPVHHRKKRKRMEEKRGKGSSRSRCDEKKQIELKNFYRFQMRDDKREKLGDLRKRFDEDKQKVAAMKADRKFKPF